MGASSAWINGEIITMTDKEARAEAILIEDGLITCVGTSDEISALAKDKKISVTDLDGACVLPGLHDCHVHVMVTGTASMGVDVYDAGSVAGVLKALKEESIRNPEGWVVGVRLDESRLTE